MRAWLALAFGSAAGLLCVVLAFAIGERADELARVHTGRYLARVALDYREKLQDSLAQRLAELKLLAALDAVPGEASRQRRRERLELSAREGSFEWLAYVDRSGTVQVASRGEAEGRNLAGAAWFRSGLRRVTIVYGESAATVELAVPLKGGNGLVVARLGRAWAERLRGALEATSDAAMHVELLLTGREGAVLAGPEGLNGVNLGRQPARGATARLERWADGQRYLVAAAQPAGRGGLDWHALARTRAEYAHGAAAELQRAILWAGLLLTLIGLAAGWVLATRHARPLEALTRAAQQIAAGHDRTELPPLQDFGEIARLAQALRAMVARLRAQAESLRDAQAGLQRRVHERTAELVKAQAELELEIAAAGLARDERAHAHAQLALALEASGLALWDYDIARDEMYLSAEWAQMLGAPAQACRMSTESFLGAVPEAARSRVRSALAAALEPGTPDLRLEHPVLRADGILIWVASHARVVERDATGRALRIMGTYRCITSVGGRVREAALAAR